MTGNSVGCLFPEGRGAEHGDVFRQGWSHEQGPRQTKQDGPQDCGQVHSRVQIIS